MGCAKLKSTLMKHIFIVMSFLYCTSATAQMDKVEHFYIKSPQAETLYNFFKDTFQLPVIWAYQTWSGFSSGSFASGGLTLGNVALEFVKSEDATSTIFEGIGLQPQGSAENTVKRLDAVRAVHDSIQPFVFTLDNGAKDTAWEVFGIHNMLPDKVHIFYCDYKHRTEINKGRKDAADSLALLRGGPLGIIGVKDIVIGCNNVTSYENKLAKLPGIKKEKYNRFTFKSGPAIQLTNSNNAGFEKIIIAVNSLDKAKNLLSRATKDNLFVTTQAIDGLIIQLVEQ